MPTVKDEQGNVVAKLPYNESGEAQAEKMLKMDNFHVVNTKKLYNRLNEINKGFSYYSKFMQWSGAGDGSRSNFTVLDINFLKDNHPNIVKKINKVYNKDFELFNFEVMKIL